MQILDKWIKSASKYIAQMNFSSGAMRYVLWYAVLLILCCGLYLTAWGVDWYIRGEPDMKQLLAFLHEIASASWIAVIGFICKGLVDKDGNGIPDEFEMKGEEQDDKRGISKRDSAGIGGDRR